MSGDPDARSPSQVSSDPASDPEELNALIRHFDDLRDGTHGGSVSRQDKEAHFARSVELLAQVRLEAIEDRLEWQIAS